MTKSISFDVLGTSFGFDTAIAAISERLGPQLDAAGIDAKTLFFSWFFAAQRDFTYASLSGAYKPMARILALTFRRACLIVDMPPSAISNEDIEVVAQAMRKLAARPGLKTCFDGLRDAGWDVYGVTNGGKETSMALFAQADIALDSTHLISCDEIQVAKPDPRVYENTKRHQDAHTKGGSQERWFAACHAWDLLAARKAGFKTAYLTYEEHDAAEEIFGKFDITAESMTDLLEKLR